MPLKMEKKLLIFKSLEKHFDLILMDMVMPVMDGPNVRSTFKAKIQECIYPKYKQLQHIL